jgi:hypothetical protein
MLTMYQVVEFASLIYSVFHSPPPSCQDISHLTLAPKILAELRSAFLPLPNKSCVPAPRLL